MLLYHVVSKPYEHFDRMHYDVSAALLDINDPSIVIARRKTTLLEPSMPYETQGQVANVIFPCGSIVMNDTLFVYYGGGDTVIGVATIKLPDLMESLVVTR